MQQGVRVARGRGRRDERLGRRKRLCHLRHEPAGEVLKDRSGGKAKEDAEDKAAHPSKTLGVDAVEHQADRDGHDPDPLPLADHRVPELGPQHRGPCKFQVVAEREAQKNMLEQAVQLVFLEDQRQNRDRAERGKQQDGIEQMMQMGRHSGC